LSSTLAVTGAATLSSTLAVTGAITGSSTATATVLNTTSTGAGPAFYFADVEQVKIQLNAQAANKYSIEKQAREGSTGDGLFKLIAGATSAGQFGFYNGSTRSLFLDSSANATFGGYVKSVGRAGAVTASKTGDYTAASTDELIRCDCSAGSLTVTLPAANAVSGQYLKIIQIGAYSANKVTIARAGSDTINGGTSTTLRTQYECLELMSDGSSAWYILRRDYPQTWTSYTPTGAWSTNTTYTGKWRRVGDSAQVRASLVMAGANTQGELTINLPSGFTIDTAKLASNTIATTLPHLKSDGSYFDQTTGIYKLVVTYHSTTAVKVRYTDDGANAVAVSTVDSSINAPVVVQNLDEVAVDFEVPIVDWN
jgi:hypothetical protein